MPYVTYRSVGNEIGSSHVQRQCYQKHPHTQKKEYGVGVGPRAPPLSPTPQMVTSIFTSQPPCLVWNLNLLVIHNIAKKWICL
jgi:hypothetical protein